jgi:hypothetical protein
MEVSLRQADVRAGKRNGCSPGATRRAEKHSRLPVRTLASSRHCCRVTRRRGSARLPAPIAAACRRPRARRGVAEDAIRFWTDTPHGINPNGFSGYACGTPLR